MRAIRRTIEGVTYDTGSAEEVHRAWPDGAGGDGEVERILFRSDEGRWFEVCREKGQLYGALQPLSEAEAAQWRIRNGAPMAAGETGAARSGRWRGGPGLAGG